MTAQELYKKIIDYYGNYSDGVSVEVVKWFTDNRNANFSMLWEELKRTHSTQFKTQPDVYVLEKALSKVQDKYLEYYKPKPKLLETESTVSREEALNFMAEITNKLTRKKRIK
jgi:hypothetical protein